MRGTAHRLSDAPLSDLFPGIGTSPRTRMIQSADMLDQARVPGDHYGWRWYAKHVIPIPWTAKDLSPLILGTVLSVPAPEDRLELSLDVWHSVPPLITVTATVDVDCWCATNHQGHTVEAAEWPASTHEAMADAFDRAARTVIGWLDGPREASAWRARVGLPNPP